MNTDFIPTVYVRLPIKLSQLLKLANIAQTGGEAGALIMEGHVDVDGEPELRRGRKLTGGELISCGGQQVRVAAKPQ